MTQEEIVRSLRFCTEGIGCGTCPRQDVPEAIEDCGDGLMIAAADLIENQQREIEALKSALHEMADDLVAFGRVDYWLCDYVPEKLHIKHQPKNDGNYENEPCVECVKEFYLQKAWDKINGKKMH